MKSFFEKVMLAVLMVLMPIAFVSAQQVVSKGAEAKTVTKGYQFTEGPLWHPDGYLLFSDIPANTVYKWTPGGEATEYLKPSGHSNGLVFDQQGRLLLAQHDGSVSRLTDQGKLSTIVESYQGKRLNSPNDITVTSDGAIYFTDPSFGVSDENKELEFQGVYRYTKNGGLQLLVDDFDLPNGLAFSPDETRLYINDTQHNHIRVFQVNEDGTLGDGEVFATMEADADGAADGMVVDSDGNLYSTGPGGLWIFSPEGQLLQQIDMPRLTNLAWGGPENSTLYLTSPSAILRLQTNQKGIN